MELCGAAAGKASTLIPPPTDQKFFGVRMAELQICIFIDATGTWAGTKIELLAASMIIV